MKKILSSTFVIIGTLIGAGFASGKEIDIFFYKYGQTGLIGLIIASVILAGIVYVVLDFCKKRNIKNYEDFLKIICINQKIYYILKIVINIFLLMSFYIMVAAFGAYFEQELMINKMIGIIIIIASSYIVFMTGAKGLIKVNALLVPIIIITIVYFGSINNYNILNMNNIKIENTFSWIISAIIYASYNSIILIPVLVQIRNTKINSIIISILSFTLIFILGQIVYFLLFNIQNIDNYEIPTVTIVGIFGSKYRYIFGITVLLSIFTSCISAGNAFLSSFEGKKYKILNSIICVSAIFISQIGFSNLVNILYPLFGVLGIMQIFLLIKKFLKSLEKKAKN